MTDNENRSASPFTVKRLENMLERYNIGKKPLAKLLGWGETAIINLKADESGNILPGDYTDILKRLDADPVMFTKLLLENRSAITTAAYNRSLEKMREVFELTDISEAAYYVYNLLDASERTVLRIETILSWTQVCCLGFDKEPVFDEAYSLSDNLLPYGEIKNRIEKYGCIRPDGLYPPDNTSEPTDEEKEILSGLCGAFGWYGEKALIAFNNAEHKKMLKLSAAESIEKNDIDINILSKYAKRILNRSKVTDMAGFVKILHTRMITAMNNSDKMISGALVTLDKMRHSESSRKKSMNREQPTMTNKNGLPQ